jgi:cytochrome c553
MKLFVELFASLVLTAALSASAFAENPEWAYPVTPKPEPLDNVVMKTAKGSIKQYTQAQIDDPFNPPDWFPDDHPPMPQVVAHGGERPAGRACGLCHLTSGDGHPESASLAGVQAAYIIRQMGAFKNGERTGGRTPVMVAMAKVLSDDEVRAGAEYFAALKPNPTYNKVMEIKTVAKSYVGAGGMRFVAPDGGTEPIGNRIIVLPVDDTEAKLRNPHFGFIDYVPVGSIARGEALAMGKDDKTIRCAICHGQNLTGLGEVPPITGRTATYTFRQLNDMRSGARTGPWVELMKGVVANLTQSDMIALAAYLESRSP